MSEFKYSSVVKEQSSRWPLLIALCLFVLGLAAYLRIYSPDVKPENKMQGNK